MRWRSRLRHCATSRKVAGSIHDSVTGRYPLTYPYTSSSTMDLGSTQTLSEMSTKNIFWRVKVTGVHCCQFYQLRVPTVLKGTFTSWNSQGLNRDCIFMLVFPNLSVSFYTPHGFTTTPVVTTATDVSSYSSSGWYMLPAFSGSATCSIEKFA